MTMRWLQTLFCKFGVHQSNFMGSRLNNDLKSVTITWWCTHCKKTWTEQVHRFPRAK